MVTILMEQARCRPSIQVIRLGYTNTAVHDLTQHTNVSKSSELDNFAGYHVQYTKDSSYPLPHF